jgi:glyoxylase-like metal-dependent hydrolase (beta-lactamase superfamily II)
VQEVRGVQKVQRVRGAKGAAGAVCAIGVAIAGLIALFAPLAAAPLAPLAPPAPTTVRLYVLDGGTLESDPARYRLTKEEVSATQLSVTAFLIVHPKGTLMWDTGAIADDSWTPNGRPVQRRLVLSNSQERRVTLRTTMTAQLKAIGYAPADITYLALSHYHWDHTANANLFVRSTWLARQIERDAMLPESVPDPPQPSNFADLKNGKTVVITSDDHDVFGDGSVVLKLAKGHTPGHQVLYVKLAKTGGVVLSGDLYHYPEERTLNRLPTFEFNVDQTRESRVAIDAFLKQTGAQLWIQHDLRAMQKVKKAPAFYE